MKQLAQAGVTVSSYLDGQEIAMETAIDKFLLSAVNFAAEIEREKTRQRVRHCVVPTSDGQSGAFRAFFVDDFNGIVVLL